MNQCLTFRLFLPIAAVGWVILAGLSGCGRPQSAKDGPTQVKLREAADDTFATASKLLKQGTELTHYRDGLALVNAHFNKARFGEDRKEPAVRSLTEKEKEFLRTRFALDDAQLKYVGESIFPLPDAFHVEACFLFRDAARALEVSGLSKAEQVAHALRWVARHVLLHEQHDVNLPPQFVLKRGFGNARDRALVFLQLLRQMDLGGCLVEVEMADAPDLILVGVVTSGDEGTLLLFDPRLAKAVAGPGGKAGATLNEALKEPALLKAHGIPSFAADNVKLRLASSLGSLAPRMNILENKLAAHVRIILYQDTHKLSEQIETITGMEVDLWDADQDKTIIPPAHLLMRFLPSKEEGGMDETSRLQDFKRRLFPTAEIHARLQEMRIVVPEIPQAARDQLLNMSRELFSKFLLEPRDMLLHGKPDDAIKRLNRILTALDDFDQRELKGEKFQEEIAKWRDKVNDSYARALKKKARS